MTPTTTNTEWFTSTSDKPYDRHYYTINNKRFDDYEHLRTYWWHKGITKGLTVNVMDYKKSKHANSAKGF